MSGMKVDLTDAEVLTIEKLADIALKAGGLQNMGVVHAFWTGFVQAVQRAREAQAEAARAEATKNSPKLTEAPSFTPKDYSTK